MRILILTTSYPSVRAPFNGVFVRAHARELVRRGHEVLVSVPHVFAEDPAREGEPGLEVRRVAYGSDGRLLSDRSGVPVAMVARLLVAWRAEALRIAGEWRPDVVHAHWAIPSGLPARLAARRASAPLVVTVHRADVEIACRRRSSAGRLMRDVLGGADRVIAVSEVLAQQLAAEFGVPGERLEVLPMGVDTTIFAPGSRRAARADLELADDVPIVLGAGALIGRKRFSDVVQAWRVVHGARPEARLLIAGDGPERRSLEQRAIQLGLAGSVRFLGAVENEELPKLVTAADVVVLASESEGLPVVLMEAAAVGTPSVATNVGGSQEAVRLHPLGRLVDVGDVEGLGEALSAVLAAEQPDVRASVVPAGSRYTIAGAVGRIEALYAELAERNR